MDKRKHYDNKYKKNEKYASGNKKPNSAFFCEHCKVHGHTMDRCRKVHGYPPGFKSNSWKKEASQVSKANGVSSTDAIIQGPTQDQNHTEVRLTSEQINQLLSLLNKQPHNDQSGTINSNHFAGTSTHFTGNCCFLSNSSSAWILDSGASDHICYNLSLFKSYHVLHNKNHEIIIPNGTTIKVKYIGTVVLENNLILRDVLYVPGFKFNLVSVSKLVKEMTCNIAFTKNACYIQEQLMKKPLLLGRLQHNLYYVQDKVCKKNACSGDNFEEPADSTALGVQEYENTIVNKAKMWHLRLGHLPFIQICILFPDLMRKNVNKHHFVLYARWQNRQEVLSTEAI